MKVLQMGSEQFTVPKDENNYVAWLCTFISDNRDCFGNTSQIQNIIDEIAAEVDRCIYKLNFLS